MVLMEGWRFYFRSVSDLSGLREARGSSLRLPKLNFRCKLKSIETIDLKTGSCFFLEVKGDAKAGDKGSERERD